MTARDDKLAHKALGLLKRDANNRALRTIYQLVVVSIVVDVFPVVIKALDEAAPMDWARLARAAIRAVLMATVAYMMRRYADISPIPTPKPPADPGPATAPTT